MTLNRKTTQKINSLAKTNLFKVELLGLVGTDLFAECVTKCNVDFHNKTITLSIMQPGNDKGMMDTIFWISSYSFDLSISQMNNDGIVSYSNNYLDCNTESHSLHYDYRTSDILTHDLVITFNAITIPEK